MSRAPVRKNAYRLVVSLVLMVLSLFGLGTPVLAMGNGNDMGNTGQPELIPITGNEPQTPIATGPVQGPNTSQFEPVQSPATLQVIPFQKPELNIIPGSFRTPEQLKQEEAQNLANDMLRITGGRFSDPEAYKAWLAEQHRQNNINAIKHLLNPMGHWNSIKKMWNYFNREPRYINTNTTPKG
jgi:hypothetical protein